ncbi:MAG: DUF2817 domain-containing protein [Anaerolineaceae bacterium]|nr:DUF2817 domain-containing protein [Anaerolineaceae bacterium]
MNLLFLSFGLIILLTTASCQTTLVAEDLPTLAPTLPPPPAVDIVIRPTQTPRPIVSPPPTALPTYPPTPTPRPVTAIPTLTRKPVIAQPVTPVATLDLSITPTGTSPATLIPEDNTFVIGHSGQGRDILGWRFGQGDKILLLVGGIHGGFEGNTVTLVNELIAHFENTPEDVLPGISIILIPTANPDGLALGRQTEGRFNANGVDLNRNWGCEWSPDAVWRDEQVDPGPHAFSEPETQALAAFIRQLQPSAAVFYHAAAEGVFAGDCEGGHGSDQLAAVIGEAAGYAYGEEFSAYPVTGTAASWIDGQGIPAVDLELSTTRSSEFDRNLRGVLAVEAWLLGR